MNLVAIRTPQSLIDDTETTDGDVRLTERDDMIASEVPLSIFHARQHNTLTKQVVKVI